MKFSPNWLVGLVLLAFWPVWRWYFLRVTDGSDEPWGILALVVGIAFAWRHREEIRITPKGMGIATATILFYGIGYHFIPPLVRAIVALATIGILTGTLLRFSSIWGLFVLSMPIVASMQFYVGYPMRLVAAVVAENCLQLGQLEVARRGTDLIYQGTVVGVDPPCSGIEMLWVGLFIVLLSGAWYRWSFRQTILAIGVGIFGVVLANSFRVTLLFFKESRIVDLPEWTHEGIGLVLFTLLILSFGQRIASAAPVERTSHSLTFRTGSGSLVIICAIVFASVIPLLQSDGANSFVETETKFPGWPQTMDGHYLEPLELSPAEEKFASSFPGKIGVFRAGGDRVILRWVTRPTRKLHSSADCLRASGYQIDSERTGRFFAFSSDGEQGWVVEEKICEDLGEESGWKEVSSWFWSASLGKSTGPWWAITKIRPL